MHFHIVPLTIEQANWLVFKWHRHHKSAVGARFCLGAVYNRVLVGTAIVGRPVSRKLDQYGIAEVTRLATDGTKNACSFLYSASARVAREMGFWKIQTYILESEAGVSLKAAGWKLEAGTKGGNWNCSWRKGRREDQPMCSKQRWVKVFSDPVEWVRPVMKSRVQVPLW